MIPLLALAFIIPILLRLSNAQEVQLRTVYQFPNGTWVENIAVRSNGMLLVTLVNTPELWEVDPFENSARLIHHFEEATMCNGVTELQEDVFTVIASNVIHQVEFDSVDQVERVSEVVNVTEAGVLNGMATFDAQSGVVVVSDSLYGLVWRIDVSDGSYDIVLQDATMIPRTGRRSLIGINGIKVWENFVYYNNCPGELFCRVAVNLDTARAIGPYEIIAEGPLVLADDFVVSPDGISYLAGLDNNIVSRVSQNGTVEIVAGNLNSSALIGATAAAFGRTSEDSNVLYVTTGGGEAAPVNGTYVEGGKVVALNL